jgi:hypothetical protein
MPRKWKLQHSGGVREGRRTSNCEALEGSTEQVPDLVNPGPCTVEAIRDMRGHGSEEAWIPCCRVPSKKAGSVIDEQ